MPSAALHRRVDSLEQEADLLENHAKILSAFASELSSFASTISLQADKHLAHSDQLNDHAGMIMAGGPIMEMKAGSEHHMTVKTRLARQAARAEQTTSMRKTTMKALRDLTSMLDHQIQDMDSALQQGLAEKRQSALQELVKEVGLAAKGRVMDFETGKEQKSSRGQKRGHEAMVAFDATEGHDEQGRAEKRRVAAITELLKDSRRFNWEAWSKGEKKQYSHNTEASMEGEEYKSGYGLQGWQCCEPMVQCEGPRALLSKADVETLTQKDEFSVKRLPWKHCTTLREAGDSLRDSPDDEDAIDGEWAAMEAYSVESDAESDIYDADLPSYEEGMDALEEVIETDGSKEMVVLQNFSGLAAGSIDLTNFDSFSRTLILEAAERAGNSDLASGPLNKCAAAILALE